MTSKPKSFRLGLEDISKLKIIHNYYKQEYYARAVSTNTDNLFRWSEAQTLALLIREKYQQLKDSGEVE